MKERHTHSLSGMLTSHHTVFHCEIRTPTEVTGRPPLHPIRRSTSSGRTPADLSYDAFHRAICKQMRGCRNFLIRAGQTPIAPTCLLLNSDTPS